MVVGQTVTFVVFVVSVAGSKATFISGHLLPADVTQSCSVEVGM